MLNTYRLRLLLELQQRITLTQVAAAMHVTPSAVSQQLTLLEREAGVALLRRVGRGVDLTAQGELLARHAEVILRELEEATSALAASGDHATGTIRVAVFQSAAVALMPRALSALSVSYPGLRITMAQQEPEQALRETWARGFDLVVAEQYPDHAAPWHVGLDRALTTDRLILAVPPAQVRWGAVESLGQAAEFPWVMEPHDAASRHWAEQRCRAEGFEPDVRFETADLQAQVALIESGNAVGVIPELMLAHAPTRVRSLALPGNPERSIFTATRPSMRRHPGVTACRAALAVAATDVTAELSRAVRSRAPDGAGHGNGSSQC